MLERRHIFSILFIVPLIVNLYLASSALFAFCEITPKLSYFLLFVTAITAFFYANKKELRFCFWTKPLLLNMVLMGIYDQLDLIFDFNYKTWLISWIVCFSISAILLIFSYFLRHGRTKKKFFS